jgi:hypothetical protein
MEVEAIELFCDGHRDAYEFTGESQEFGVHAPVPSMSGTVLL